MTYKVSIAILCLVGITISSCRKGATTSTTSSVGFGDTDIQKIYNAGDKRDTKAILPYLQNEEMTYRLAAAQVMGSVQDSSASAIEALHKTLATDKSEEVREAAAFALGQSFATRAGSLLTTQFGKEKSMRVKAAILEAVGKTANLPELNYLATTQTYRPSDSVLQIGKVRGIFAFAQRELVSPEGTTAMAQVIMNTTTNKTARSTAAYYLHRTKTAYLTEEHIDTLSKLILKDTEPTVRMYLCAPLARSGSKRTAFALDSLMRSEKDWRVRTALINSMYWYGYSIAYTTYMRGLSDANQHVVLATIGEMTKYGSAKSIEFFLEKAKLETRPIISTAYYAAALKLCPVKARDTKINISQILIEKYKASKDLYEQGSILDALTGYADNYKFIKEQTFARDAKPVIKSYGIEALVKLRRNPEFGYSFGKGQREAVRILDSLFQMAILTGDPALTAVASEVLRDSTMGFRERLVNDPRFLSDGQRKLKLPRDIEAYNELQKTIDHFTYKKTPTKKVDYNHSIDYAVLNELSATPTAIIKTAKGEIELKLFPQIAPGSVANFVKLANAGFFNNKVFHRVVPNFVVQGGCPRGDGWGSQDFTIRSEFSIQAHYDDAGWVGMASAGKDTESSQWFITHSPTPHLDGRYSIFAKVIKGMDTVDKLVVGDKMTSVKIQ